MIGLRPWGSGPIIATLAGRGPDMADRPTLQITAARPESALLDLPWGLPLGEWPARAVGALPRGISRHVVRFAKLSGRVVAVKEIRGDLARREYGLLRLLNRLDVPSVE